jgi:hypothetical protein
VPEDGLPYDSVPEDQQNQVPTPTGEQPVVDLEGQPIPDVVRTGQKSAKPIEAQKRTDQLNAQRILANPHWYKADQVAWARTIMPVGTGVDYQPRFTGSTTPELEAKVLDMWRSTTFPKELLEGRPIRVHFIEEAGQSYAGRSGNIVLSTLQNKPEQAFLHELGHLADFWVLQQPARDQMMQHLGTTQWDYLAQEAFANSFARAYSKDPWSISLPWGGIPEDMIRGFLTG